MHCPRCGKKSSVDKTQARRQDGDSTIRSRRCDDKNCGYRFKSEEFWRLPEVKERSDRAQPFDPLRLLAALRLAFRGLPDAAHKADRAKQAVIKRLMGVAETEAGGKLSPQQIATATGAVLRESDDIAYVRYMADRRIFVDGGERPAAEDIQPQPEPQQPQPGLFDRQQEREDRTDAP